MNTDVYRLKEAMGFSQVPDFLFFFVFFIFFYLFFIFPLMGLFTFVCKKTIADQQARIGPKLVGLSGFSQGFADLIKIIFKENTHPSHFNGLKLVYNLLPFCILVFLPFSEEFFFSSALLTPLVLFFIILVNKFLGFYLASTTFTLYAFLQSLRQNVTSFISVLPAMLSVFAVIALVGETDWNHIVQSQGFWFYEWNIFKHPPFLFFGFFVFMISGWILVGVYPSTFSSNLGFSYTHAEEDFHIGKNYFLSALTHFIYFFSWSLFAVTLFCGGWSLPDWCATLLKENELIFLKYILETILISFKAFVVMLLSNWVYVAMPRARSDQSTDFLWKVLSIIAMIILGGSIAFYQARLF